MQTTKKILIAGGNGFIGRHLTQRALNQNLKVTVLGVSERHSELPTHRDLRFVRLDLTSAEELSEKLSDPDFHYVINTSGYIQHTPIKDGGRHLFEQHFISTLNLVEYLNRDVLERFVQVGSSDEYGNAPSPQSETLRETPIAPYSLGKTASSHLLQMLAKTESFPAVVVRLFLVYGPGQDLKRFLPQIITGCLKDKEFPTSQGEQLRDFCYVSDIVEGIFKSLESPKINGEIFNLASGEGIPIQKMVKTIQTLIGKGAPLYGKIPYRPSENMRLFADIQKARSLLNWSPEITIEKGLQQTIEYYNNK